MRYENKGELANARVNDKIRVTFTDASEGWQLYVCDAASYSEFTDGYFDGDASDEELTISFTIADATTLESIQEKGIVVKGKLATLTKIELLTYASSYDAVAVTISSTGYATFSSNKKLDFSGTGITPYYASAVATGTVTLTATSTTWDYQGYLLQGSEGTYTVPVTDDASYSSPNYLKQSATSSTTVVASTAGTYHYVFAKKNDDSEYGFYKLTSDYTLEAKKAYLETEDDIMPTNGDARIAFVFDNEQGETTAIQTVEVVNSRDIYYNMNGMRVEQPTKGLYIKNGKKVIIK